MAISHLVYKLDWLPVFNYSTSLRDVLRYYRESKHGILSLGVSRWKWNWNFFVSSITIFFDFFFLKNPVKRSFNVFTVILILNRSCFYQAFFLSLSYVTMNSEETYFSEACLFYSVFYFNSNSCFLLWFSSLQYLHLMHRSTYVLTFYLVFSVILSL